MKFLVKGIKNACPTTFKTNALSKEEAKIKAYATGIIPTQIIAIPQKNILLKSLSSHKKELIISFKQIAFMSEASLPIDEILTYCIDGSKHPKIQMMYQDILKTPPFRAFFKPSIRQTLKPYRKNENRHH